MTSFDPAHLPPGTEVCCLLRGSEEPTRAEVRCFIPAWCGRGAYSLLVREGELTGKVATVPARCVWVAGGSR